MCKPKSGLFEGTEGAPNHPYYTNTSPEGKALIDEVLKRPYDLNHRETSNKITPSNVIGIIRNSNANPNYDHIAWLETGDEDSGLTHLLIRHLKHFTKTDNYSQLDIPDAIFTALTTGVKLTYIKNNRAAGAASPIYRYLFKGEVHYMQITVGANGYIVSANPTTAERIKKRNLAYEPLPYSR